MKKYRCVNCGAIFTGWGIGETCRDCGGKLELLEEREKVNKKEE